MTEKIKVDAVSVTYRHRDRSVPALVDLDLTVKQGEFLCILGPSGCGKSTLLHLIAGFIKPTKGAVFIDGQQVRHPGPDRAVVFQRHNLLPWKTVFENVAFGLRMKHMPKDERDVRVATYLRESGLEGFTTNYPRELSEGMQQRVGIARAFANEPYILLMDEPFASLDAQTARRMRELLLEIWNKERQTVVFVTHDADEAIMLADRIVILTDRPGRVERDIPVDLDRPRKRNFFAEETYRTLRKYIDDLV